MALVTIRPTRFDQAVASAVASHTDRAVERGAETVTWAGDEHVLLALAALGWLLTRNCSYRQRRVGSHVLACSAVTALLPHAIKLFIDQERPDRLTIEGHLRGVPLSGKSEDAFPSGHALHMGALASLATLFQPRLRNAIWGVGAVVVATRIILMAHWLSDVLAGLALGALVERGIRCLTKP